MTFKSMINCRRNKSISLFFNFSLKFWENEVLKWNSTSSFFNGIFEWRYNFLIFFCFSLFTLTFTCKSDEQNLNYFITDGLYCFIQLSFFFTVGLNRLKLIEFTVRFYFLVFKKRRNKMTILRLFPS